MKNKDLFNFQEVSLHRNLNVMLISSVVTLFLQYMQLQSHTNKMEDMQLV